MTGPAVDRIGTPSSLAMMVASVVLRRNRDVQVFADALLADVLVEGARPEPRLVLTVLLIARRGYDAIVLHVLISARSTSRSA
jgi:hypothetical protein